MLYLLLICNFKVFAWFSIAFQTVAVQKGTHGTVDPGRGYIFTLPRGFANDGKRHTSFLDDMYKTK